MTETQRMIRSQAIYLRRQTAQKLEDDFTLTDEQQDFLHRQIAVIDGILALVPEE